MTLLQAPPAPQDTTREALLQRYRKTRALSLELVQPLTQEEWRIQSMPDVSPPWWNLGHTTWFFCRNILTPRGLATAEDEQLEYVLNSYYESLGPRLPRHRRGSVGRPTNATIRAYRISVDERMERLLTTTGGEDWPALSELVRVGIEHEQQHQELLVTEIQHILATLPLPLRPVYQPGVANPEVGNPAAAANETPEARFQPIAGGLVEIGHGEVGWSWDNEQPRHKAWVEDFLLLDRLVTCSEYLEFIADGGYRQPLLWLSNGWQAVQEQGWQAPMYWRQQEDQWRVWGLTGDSPLLPAQPVAHLSFYEADAFLRWKGETDAAWAGARLPTEREWEHAARAHQFESAEGHHLDDGEFRPRPANAAGDGLRQLRGGLWEWTSSHYEPYPGYRPFGGALMEYNGKFMDNQRVLRGGSWATPRDHIRVSYRNFWPADTRFQLTGVRALREIDR
ncbi:MAG: ergothioneine biosynthesis protein EgtB [Acidobacteriota bacterium]